MARNQRKSGTRSPGRSRGRGRSRWTGSRIGLVVAAVLAVVAVTGVPTTRWFWARGEASPLARGVELLGEQGCVACHGDPSGSWRWRADGAPPASVEMIRDAVLNGRPGALSFPGPMPPMGGRLQVDEWRALVLAVGVLEGLVGVPEDPELASGYDIARQMGCFGCHGVLGAGGVPNPGSLTGRIPGWLGNTFRRTLEEDGRLRQVILQGSPQARVPVPGVPGSLLAMPAWGERLDSVEVEILVRYLRWLHENPPALEP